MVLLSSNSIIFWSINNSCVLEIFTYFGIVLCTGTFKNGITYSFTTDKVSWSCVNFSQFLLKWPNLPANCRFKIFPVNNFLLKSKHLLETLQESILQILWTREPVFNPNFAYLRHHCSICSFVSHYIAHYVCLDCLVFYRGKNALHHTVNCCAVKTLKELFGRRRSAMISTRKKPPMFFSWSVLFQQHATWTFCHKDFDRLFGVNLLFPSRYFQLIWGPLLRFLIFANVDYTKSSLTLGLEEVLFVQST